MSDRAAGNIYDLGYQRYDGPRLGRRHAIWALYRESLRSAFGLGRRAAAKIAPSVLVFIAIAPALLQVLGGILGGDNIEIARHDEYYQLVTFVLALYVAVIAPDIVGRDQKNRTLALYFTRAISRGDYVLAKFLALTSAMLLVTLVPQLVMFLGNALVAESFGDHLRDDLDQLPPIFGTAVLGSALIASIGSAIAAQTAQRAFATIGIVASFLVTLVLAGVLVETVDSLAGRLAVFISPFALLEGFTVWMFRADLDSDSMVRTADLHLGYYAAAAVVVTAIGYGLLLRRYRSVQP